MEDSFDEAFIDGTGAVKGLNEVRSPYPVAEPEAVRHAHNSMHDVALFRFILPQPSTHSIRESVNVTHPRDLANFLGVVFLVDTNRINPELRRWVVAADSLKPCE